MHIEVRELTKIYRDLLQLERHVALDHVSLEIHPGEIVALLGSNGAGKSTLLKSLLGLVSPTSGQLVMDGQVFSRQRIDLRKRVGYLADKPILLPGSTLLKHISMVVACYDKQRPGLAEQIVAWLRELDLISEIDRLTNALSRGQQYKVALVGLLAADPELWVIDEPFASGMDPQGLTAFRHHARNAAARGSTVIYSTQILEVAERFADRICILQAGKVIAFDTLPRLRDRIGSRDADLQAIYELLSDPTS